MTVSRLFMLAAVILFSTGQVVAQEEVRSPNPLATIDRATLNAFVEKPLFELSRRQPVVEPPHVYVAPPAPTLVEQPPSLRLLGLVESRQSIFALVYRNDKRKTETMRSGDRIGSWVVQITTANLRVVSGNRAFEYKLFRGDPSKGPVAVQMLPPALVTPAVAARNPAMSTR